MKIFITLRLYPTTHDVSSAVSTLIPMCRSSDYSSPSYALPPVSPYVSRRVAAVPSRGASLAPDTPYSPFSASSSLASAPVRGASLAPSRLSRARTLLGDTELADR